MITNKRNNTFNICKCGCDKRVSRLGNRYILGHGRRLPKEIRFCKCGCKQTFECKINSNRKYISGHNRGAKGKHHSEESKRKNKEAREGFIVFKKTKRKLSKAGSGKLKSEEHKRKIGKSLTGRKLTQKTKDKMSKSRKGKHFSNKHKKELVKSLKKRWQNPDYAEKQFKAIFAGNRLRPTKPERRLRNRLNNLFPREYKYVGDGTTFIGGKCPDFININGQKKIVEIFGDYWHGEEITGRTKRQEEQRRIRHFAKYGFKTLIVWQRELKNIRQLRKKLVQFHKIS